MANTFKNQSTAVGTSDTDVLTSGGQCVVLGLKLGNVSSNQVTATVKIYDGSASSAKTIVNAIPIPANGALEVIDGDKMVLENTDKIQVSCSAGSALNAIASYLEIT